MNIAAIDTAFKEVINRRGIHKTAGRSLNSVLQLRWRFKHTKNVSYSTKIFYLQKAGVHMEKYLYTEKDLVSLLNFYNRTSQSARNLGNEYVVEKWKNLK